METQEIFDKIEDMIINANRGIYYGYEEIIQSLIMILNPIMGPIAHKIKYLPYMNRKMMIWIHKVWMMKMRI